MYILHLVCCYMTLIYNKKNGGSGCFFLAVSSASDGSSAKGSAIILKMPKANHIKIVTFRNHFSRSLINIYGLICSSRTYPFYFFAQFSVKKVFQKLYLSIFLQFLIHFLIPSGTNFITNIKYGVWGWEKNKTTSVGLRKCQQETISQKWLKLAKNKTIESFVSTCSAPNAVRSSQIDQSCFTECIIL